MVVAVNNMDDASVGYSELRFDTIKHELQQQLKKIGYNTSRGCEFVPISSWCGDLISESSSKMTWYRGPSLIKALESLQMRKYPNKHAMVVTTDITKVSDLRYTALGRIHGGPIKEGN